MMEMPASSLQPGDEFTIDNGETWHTIKVCRSAKRGQRVVIINTHGREVILKSEQMVIAKV